MGSYIDPVLVYSYTTRTRLDVFLKFILCVRVDVFMRRGSDGG